MPQRQHRKHSIYFMSVFLTLAAAAFVLLISIRQDNPLEIFERKVYDTWMLLRGERPEHPDILIVGISSEDLQHLQKWPWPGWLWAFVLEELKEQKPAAIVFDVLFNEPEEGVLRYFSDEERRQDPTVQRMAEVASESFGQFVAAVHRSQHVYLSAYLDLSPGVVGATQSREELKKTLELPRFSPANIVTPDNFSSPSGLLPEEMLKIPDGNRYVLPLSRLLDAATGVGFINAEPDSDGITRKSRLLGRIGATIYPSLDLQVLSDYLGVPLDDFKIIPGREIIIPRAQAEDFRIPITEEGQMFVNFKGREAYLRNSISITQFLSAVEKQQSGEPFRIRPDIVRDKIIFIGMVAEGNTDVRATPVNTYYPMVAMHANVMGNILSRDFIWVMPTWMEMALIILTCLLVGLILPRLYSFFPGGLFPLALLVIMPFVAYVCFANFSWWIPTVRPALAVGLGYLSVVIYYFVAERGQRRLIMEVFGRCVDRTVVSQIADSGLDPQLGGNRRFITVMFADIRGFTSYSERHQAEDVVGKLNQFFTAMSEVIFHYQGTIDKYMGDEIMLFFGDPVPMEDHALRAVRCAVKMQERMTSLQEGWGDKSFSQGIGIHTGEVIVGWIGSPTRKEYTVIGDTVNTAFRYEGVAKADQVLISQVTYNLVKEHVEVRKLDPIMVKGKSEPQQVYEVLGLSGDDRQRAPVERKTVRDSP
jgi:adenylate cyclase